MWWGYGFGWFFPAMFFFTFFVIFWLVVALLFSGRWRSWGYRRGHPYWAGDRSPEDLLADRFARGEIDEDEYNTRMEALRRQRG